MDRMGCGRQCPVSHAFPLEIFIPFSLFAKICLQRGLEGMLAANKFVCLHCIMNARAIFVRAVVLASATLQIFHSEGFMLE